MLQRAAERDEALIGLLLCSWLAGRHRAASASGGVVGRQRETRAGPRARRDEPPADVADQRPEVFLQPASRPRYARRSARYVRRNNGHRRFGDAKGACRRGVPHAVRRHRVRFVGARDTIEQPARRSASLLNVLRRVIFSSFFFFKHPRSIARLLFPESFSPTSFQNSLLSQTTIKKKLER